MLRNIRPHLRPTLLLAYPVVLSQLGHIMVSFVDSVLVGRTGTVPLAAVSLGVNSTNVIMILGIGLSMGAVPLVAAADGRRDLPDDVILIDGAVETIPETLIAQLAPDGRLAACLVDRNVQRLVIGRRAGSGFGVKSIVDAAAAPLPGFARPHAFTF